MTALTVTISGQITLTSDLLAHLGVQPGQQVNVDKLPGGELRIHVASTTGTIDAFVGLLSSKGSKTLSIEEINESAAAGWAGEKEK